MFISCGVFTNRNTSTDSDEVMNVTTDNGEKERSITDRTPQESVKAANADDSREVNSTNTIFDGHNTSAKVSSANVTGSEDHPAYVNYVTEKIAVSDTDTGFTVFNSNSDSGTASNNTQNRVLTEEEKALLAAIQTAKDRLDRAEEAVAKAEEDVLKKQNALEEARSAFENITRDVNSTAEEIASAREVLKQKQTAYADAEAKRAAAYTDYINAVNESINSSAYQEALATVEEKNGKLIDAMTTAAAVLSVYDRASAAVTEAEAEVSAMKETVIDAESRLEGLKQNQDATEQALSEAENGVNASRDALNKAEENLRTAKDAYEAVSKELSENEAYRAAVAAIETSNNEMLQAIGAAAESAEKVGEAKDVLDTAREQKADAETRLSEKKAEAEAADQAVAEAYAAVETAKSILSDAEADKEAALQAVANAEAGLEEAQQTKEQISREIEETRSEMEGYDRAIEEARVAYEQAAAAYKEAKNQVALGSIGFFREREAEQGATASIDDLLNVAIANTIAHGLTATGITNVGAEGDATSLENMKLAISYLYECNELRATDDNNSGPDKEPLTVSDTMMLGAQVEANYASEDYNHNSLFSGDWMGQILAAMYNDQDPYYAWYTKEKRVYDEGRSGTTGHYKIIANPEGSSLYRYTTTGIGVNSTGGNSNKNRKTWMQNFYRGNPYREKAYSVEEYEASFLEYYERVMGAMNTAQDAMDDAKNAYIASINANTGMSAEDKEALIASAEAMFSTSDGIQDVEDQIAHFSQLYECAALAVSNSTAKAESQQAFLDRAVAELTDEQAAAYPEFVSKIEEYYAIQAEMEDCPPSLYNELKARYEALSEEINAFVSENGLGSVASRYYTLHSYIVEIENANKYIESVQGKIDEMNAQKAELEEEFADLQTQYGVDLLASGATAEEKEKLDRLSIELSEINAAINDLTTSVEAGKQTVQDAETAVEAAKSDVISAEAQTEAAVAESDAAHRSLEAAEADGTAADAAVAEAEAKLNTAKRELDEAEADAALKKAAYEETKANAEAIAREINSTIDSATADVEAAQANVAAAAEAYYNAAAVMNAAAEDDVAARQAVQEAENALETAQAMLAEAESNRTVAKEDANAKAQALSEANEAVDRARADYDSAVETASDIKSNIDAETAGHKAAYDKAESTVAQAEQEVMQAQTVLNDATAAYESASGIRDEAERTVISAEADLKESEEMLSDAVSERDQRQQEYDALIIAPAEEITVDFEDPIVIAVIEKENEDDETND